MNILISSAGRRVSLVRAFQKEVKKKHKQSKVFASDMNPELSAACNVADSYIKVPPVTNASYIDILLDHCLSNEIRILVPTIDTELLLLSKNKERFSRKKIQVIVSDYDFIQKCRNKKLTHSFFSEYGIDHANELERNNLRYPFFIKPIDGSSSKNIYTVENQDQLTVEQIKDNNLMFLEYLDPREHIEFTVDTYYDRLNYLKSAVPRQRIEVRSGEVNKGITRKNQLIEVVRSKLHCLPGVIGCITMQFFVNRVTNNVFGIEINPRFGGGYPLSYLAGANFPGWLIDEYLDNKNIDEYYDWEDNLLMLRFDDEVLIKNPGL